MVSNFIWVPNMTQSLLCMSHLPSASNPLFVPWAPSPIPIWLYSANDPLPVLPSRGRRVICQFPCPSCSHLRTTLCLDSSHTLPSDNTKNSKNGFPSVPQSNPSTCLLTTNLQSLLASCSINHFLSHPTSPTAIHCLTLYTQGFVNAPCTFQDLWMHHVLPKLCASGHTVAFSKSHPVTNLVNSL